ncbi:MAG TPA: TlpA disulfide reductase family protein, partial [Bacteroidales bacterium]|nr:TlpA disulfide reductase family protein [Bacteroidales bacterium]
MEKIKNWFRNYLRKNSKLKIFGDIIFYILVILMIIPSTRRDLSALLIKATLRKPHVKTEKSVNELTSADYQFFLQDLNGKSYNLGNFRNKVTILNFWATWCPPCRAEMPSLQKLYNDYGDKVNFVLVSSEEAGKINPFLKEEGYTMPIYIQRSQLPPAFPVQSIPATFVISKTGEIVVDKNGAANWNSPKFRQQLDEL